MFNLKKFWALVKVSTVYTGDQVISQEKRAREKKGKEIRSGYKTALMSYLKTTILMMIIYGPISWLAVSTGDYGMFNSFFIFFVILSIVQSFWMFYSGVYDAEDLSQYMALPVSSLELYTAKMTSVLLGSFIFGGPIGLMSGIISFYRSGSLALGIGVGLYGIIFTTILSVAITIVLIEVLNKTGILHRYGKVPLIVLTVFTSLCTIGFVYFMAEPTANSGFIEMIFLDDPKRSFIISLVLFAASIGIIALAGVGFVDRYIAIQANKQKLSPKRKSRQNKSIRSSIYRYKIKEMLNPSVLSQSIMAPIALIVISFINNIRVIKEMDVAGSQDSVLLLISVLFVFFYYIDKGTLGHTMISLDNHNFEYIKALPISRDEYVRYNTEMSVMITSKIMSILFIIGGIMMGASVLGIVIAIIANFVFNWVVTSVTVFRDYNDPIIGWVNTSDMVSARRNKWLYMIQIFGIMIVMSASFFVVPILILDYSKLMVDVFIITVGVIFMAIVYVRNTREVEI